MTVLVVPSGQNGPLEEASEGGDAVCWLHLVCEECGAMIERPDDPHRPGCTLAPNEPANERH